MNYSGVTKRVMGFCNVMTGRTTGGLAQVNVLLVHADGRSVGKQSGRRCHGRPKCWCLRWKRHGYSGSSQPVVTAMRHR
ncbi:MAG: hypothetical protein ACLTBV_15950 [Enterocloster bolteae]